MEAGWEQQASYSIASISMSAETKLGLHCELKP
jgi:hypothetical protein